MQYQLPLHDVFIRIFRVSGLGGCNAWWEGSGAFAAAGHHSGRAGRDQVAGFCFPDGVPVATVKRMVIILCGSSPFSTQRSR